MKDDVIDVIRLVITFGYVATVLSHPLFCTDCTREDAAEYALDLLHLYETLKS